MKTLLALAVFILLVAIWGLHTTHAQSVHPLAHFTCQDGWCVVREHDVETIQKYLKMLEVEYRRCKAI